MNFIMAEMFADDDDPVCEHCGSMNVLNLKTITPEYDDNKQPAYYEINTFGTSATYDSSWRRRRDMIEERQCCNFCGHTISLGFTWTDWYKVQDFSVPQTGLIIDPYANGYTTVDSSDPKWDNSTPLGYSNWTVTYSDNTYPQKHQNISMGCSAKGNGNGTGFCL